MAVLVLIQSLHNTRFFGNIQNVEKSRFLINWKNRINPAEYVERKIVRNIQCFTSRVAGSWLLLYKKYAMFTKRNVQHSSKEIFKLVQRNIQHLAKEIFNVCQKKYSMYVKSLEDSWLLL